MQIDKTRLAELLQNAGFPTDIKEVIGGQVFIDMKADTGKATEKRECLVTTITGLHFPVGSADEYTKLRMTFAAIRLFRDARVEHLDYSRHAGWFTTIPAHEPGGIGVLAAEVELLQ